MPQAPGSRKDFPLGRVAVRLAGSGQTDCYDRMSEPNHVAAGSFLGQNRPLSLFGWGFLLPLRAAKLILDSPRLRRWSLVVLLISLVLLAALVVLLILGTGTILGLVWPRPDDWWLLLWFPLAILLFSLLFVAGASTVPTIATAPILDFLSEETERLLGAELPPEGGIRKFLRETVGAVLKAALRVLILLAGYGVLLFFWLIPGIGQALWTVGSVGWTIYWIAYEYLDITANRHEYGFLEVVRAVRAHASASLGFGAALYLMLLVPLLNVVFIPVGAVGAAIFFVELRRSGRLPPSKWEKRAEFAGAASEKDRTEP